MSEEIKKIMQISVLGENKELTNMLADIKPLQEKRFTNLELEAEKKENFSIVLYKKENPIIRFFKEIKCGFEKLKIMNKSREIDYVKKINR